MRRSVKAWILAAVPAWLGAGCVAAAVGAAAGAGAAGAIHLTDNGAEAVIGADHQRALGAAEQAFSEFGITTRERTVETDAESGVTTAKLRGETGDGEVRVTTDIREEPGRKTRVTVTARDNLLRWDKELSRKLAERIVELSG